MISDLAIKIIIGLVVAVLIIVIIIAIVYCCTRYKDSRIETFQTLNSSMKTPDTNIDCGLAVSYLNSYVKSVTGLDVDESEFK